MGNCRQFLRLFAYHQVAFAWGILYLFLIAVPLVYTQVFGWADGKRSLPFLAMVVGCAIALAFAPLQIGGI